MHVLSAWLRRDQVVPQATSSGPTTSLSFVFSFYSCSFTWKWLMCSRGHWWRIAYLCPFNSWPESVQEIQVIYVRPFRSRGDELPAQHRGTCCFFLLLFPLLFLHSFLFQKSFQIPCKEWSCFRKFLDSPEPNSALTLSRQNLFWLDVFSYNILPG